MMRQLPLLLPHDAAMSADDFLITQCNREAAAWVEKWPDWPAHGLIVTGLPGSGKTHLLNLWREKSQGKLIEPQNLVEQDLPTLITLNPESRIPNPNSCFALDNADAVAGNPAAEENLFHLFNHLKETKGWLFLTMAVGAGQAGFALPDLRSRLLTLPATALLPPDDELLEALIVKQFRDRQINIDRAVVSYISSRMTRDAANIRAIVERLDLAALAEGCKITVPLVRKVLETDNDN